MNKKLHTVLKVVPDEETIIPQSNKDHLLFDLSPIENIKAKGLKPLPLVVVDLVVESRRQSASLSLRRKFKTLLKNCKPPILEDMIPVQAYERWLTNARMLCSHRQRAKDSLLPYFNGIEPGLVSDLMRIGLTDKEAKAICVNLGKESMSLIDTLNLLKNERGKEEGKALQIKVVEVEPSSKEEKQERDEEIEGKEENEETEDEVSSKSEKNATLNIVRNRFSITLRFESRHVQISKVHYDKLRLLFDMHTEGKMENRNDDVFHICLMNLLLRYKSLLGHGYQAATPGTTQKIFKEQFGLICECFASPLNSYFSSFCSAFDDTDAFFGSLSSFFTFFPREGSFQVNPPFIQSLMNEMVTHLHILLNDAEKAGKALMFIVLVPAWIDGQSYKELLASTFKRELILLAANDHGFHDGAQHQRQDLLRPSPFPTGIFFLQTNKAIVKWPVNEVNVSLVREAMRKALPTEGETARRVAKGRGKGDLDRKGGYNKRKRDEI